MFYLRLFLFIVFCLQLNALNLTPEEKEWIAKHPVVKVGADRNWPPLEYLNENEKYVGVANKYLDVISEKTGLKFEIHADKWSNVVDKIQNNKIDMLSCVGELESRKKFLSFTRPYLSLDFVVVGRKDLKISSFDEIKNYKIVVRKKTYVYGKLKAKFKNLDFVFVDKKKDSLKAILEGKADIYIANLALISHFFHNNLFEDNLEVKLKADFKGNVCMASSKKNKILQSILNKALNSLSETEHALIHKKWSFRHGIDKKAKTNKFSFTKEEKEWIKSNPVVKMGIDGDWVPFDFLDKVSGRQDGIANDYLKIISKKTGLKFKIFATGWKDSFEKVKKGENDVFKSTIISPYTKKYTNLTPAYIWSTIVILGEKSKKLRNIKDIKNFKVGVLNFRTAIMEKLNKKFPNKEFIPIKSDEEGIKQLMDSKIDFFIGNSVVLRYLMKKNYLNNLEIKHNLNLSKINLAIGVAKDKKILLNILTKALNSITIERRNSIKEKWIGKDSKITTGNFIFSKEERDWLKKHKVIKIVGDPSFAPYVYLENGKYKGIIPEIIDLIKITSGLSFQYVNTKNWQESLELIKNKKVDMLDFVTKSKLREDYLYITNTFLSSSKVIVSNKDKGYKYINSMNELIFSYPNKKIGLVKEYTTSLRIKNDFPDLKNIVYFSSMKNMINALSTNKIDFIVVPLTILDFYTKKMGINNLIILGISGYESTYSFGVAKNDKPLVSILNKILKSIPENEINEIYRKWVKIKYEEKVNYSLAIKISLFSILILGFILYWVYKMRNEIRNKIKIQNDLFKNKRFLSSIINSQEDIVVVTDGLNLKQANQAFYRTFNFKDYKDFKKEHNCISEFFDRSSEDYLYSSLEKNSKNWIDIILENPEKVYKVRIFINNKEFIFKVRANRIKYESSLKTAVLHDITELEKLHEDLVVAREKALIATQHKSEFLANMSHEIRTPLNAILGFTELLDKELKNPIQRDYLESLKKGGKALLVIINDILDLSKIEAGKLRIRKETINVRSLMSEVESIFYSKILEKNLNLDINISSTVPSHIILDDIRLKQILFNLIGNAIKFTRQGFIRLRVSSVYKNLEKNKIDLEITVEDSGIGIDEKDLDLIFESFEQQEEHAYLKGGTGLGLTICSRLAKLMNGKISVSSTKEVGSTFTVKFFDIPIFIVQSEKVFTEEKSKNILSFKKATILLVDDIEENRKLIELGLKNFSFDIIMAENGEEAISILNNIKVNLILMDLKMPIMDGYEATKIIKNDEKFKHIPVIALTASILEGIGKFGFDGYLRKPILLDSLIEEISKFLPCEFSENILDSKEIGDIDIKRLKKVIKALNGKLLKECDDIKKKGDLNLIKTFFDKLKELNSSNNIELLSYYLEDLKIAIDSFDVEKIDFLMNGYKGLIEKLEQLEKKYRMGL